MTLLYEVSISVIRSIVSSVGLRYRVSIPSFGFPYSLVVSDIGTDSHSVLNISIGYPYQVSVTSNKYRVSDIGSNLVHSSMSQSRFYATTDVSTFILPPPPLLYPTPRYCRVAVVADVHLLPSVWGGDAPDQLAVTGASAVVVEPQTMVLIAVLFHKG